MWYGPSAASFECPSHRTFQVRCTVLFRSVASVFCTRRIQIKAIAALIVLTGTIPLAVRAEETEIQETDDEWIEEINEETSVTEEAIIIDEQDEYADETEGEAYYYVTSTGGCYDPEGKLYFFSFEHGCVRVKKDEMSYMFPVYVIEALPEEGYETAHLEAYDSYHEDVMIERSKNRIVIPQDCDMVCEVVTRFDAAYYFETECGDTFDESGRFFIQPFAHGKLSICVDCHSYDIPAYVIEVFPQEGYYCPVLDITDESGLDVIFERSKDCVAVKKDFVSESVIHAVFEKLPYEIEMITNRKADMICRVNGQEQHKACMEDEVELIFRPHMNYAIENASVRDEAGNIIAEGSEEFLSFIMPAAKVTVTIICRVKDPTAIFYTDENGVEYVHSGCVDLSKVQSGEMTSGWYVVSRTMSVKDRLEIDGNVNLILCDGCTLLAQHGIHNCSGNELTIWCQEKGTGTLRCQASHNKKEATIGGNNSQAGGILKIHGGNIIVEGTNEDAAGIGGGKEGEGGNIDIFGGSVKVSLSDDGGGAGIGGGSGACGGHINILGGTVEANGSYGYLCAGAGIGGGDKGKGGEITIRGGTVTAKGGSSDWSGAGAGIGGGSQGEGGIIKIHGGFISSRGGKAFMYGVGAGIGGGYKGNGGSIIFYGGDVLAVSPLRRGIFTDDQGAGIGGGDHGNGSYMEVWGGRIEGQGYQAFGHGMGGYTWGTLELADNIWVKDGDTIFPYHDRYDKIHNSRACVFVR